MMNQICLPDPNRKKNARNSHIAVHPALSRSGDTPPARYHTAQDPKPTFQNTRPSDQKPNLPPVTKLPAFG